MCGRWSCAPAEAAVSASPRTRNGCVHRMSVALLFESGDDSRRPRFVAFAHFVDQRDSVLEQPDLRLEVLDKAFLRRRAVRLCVESRAAFANRLIDHGEVLLQRRSRPGIERAMFGLRN